MEVAATLKDGCFNTWARFGNSNPEGGTDQDYEAPDLADFEYDLTAFGYSREISIRCFKEGREKDEGDYASNYRYSDIASPELVKNPKAQALLQKICHGAMACVTPSPEAFIILRLCLHSPSDV